MDLRADWCRNIGLDKLSVNTNAKVCEDHFEAGCINMKRLRFDAIPTKNLPKNIEKPTQWTSDSTKVYVYRYCSIENCEINNTYGIPIFKFPSDPQRRKLWVELCNINKDIVNLNICARHFDPEMVVANIDRARLTSEAIPTIFSSIEPDSPKTLVDTPDSFDMDGMEMQANVESFDTSINLAVAPSNVKDPYEFPDTSINPEPVVPYKVYKRKAICEEEMSFEDLDKYEPLASKIPKIASYYNLESYCENCEKLSNTCQLYSKENSTQRKEICSLKKENKVLKQKLLDLESELNTSLSSQQTISSHIDSLGKYTCFLSLLLYRDQTKFIECTVSPSVCPLKS